MSNKKKTLTPKKNIAIRYDCILLITIYGSLDVKRVANAIEKNYTRIQNSQCWLLDKSLDNRSNFRHTPNCGQKEEGGLITRNKITVAMFAAGRYVYSGARLFHDTV